ncbi:MAG: hypothetical protein M0P69_20450 [Bacteroidales bacterium]|nr:hypothetical protein [Bacteroidales bacterium]
MTTPVSIGRGLCRITVRSRRNRDRLAAIPGAIIDGYRVIVPEEYAGAVTGSLRAWRRKSKAKYTQDEEETNARTE